jgi:hypothetical protein
MSFEETQKLKARALLLPFSQRERVAAKPPDEEETASALNP